jgi:hypothetical protein
MIMSFRWSGKRSLLSHRRHGAVQQQYHQRIIPSCGATAVLPENSRSLFHSVATGVGVAASKSWQNGYSVIPISNAKIVSPRQMARILEPYKCRRCTEMTTRFFFASSTDHTTLLAQAEIHVLPVAAGTTNDNNGKTTTQQIVLAPSGMDFDTVCKVPQLHMARLLLTTTRTTNDDNNDEIVIILHGAKVVNRSLGSILHVCRRLLEYAVTLHQQQQQGTVQMFAKSTLHGLSDWVISNTMIKNKNHNEIMTDATKGSSDNHNVTDFVASLSTQECKMIQAIARGDRTSFHDNNSEEQEQGGQEEDEEEDNGRNRSRTAAQLWDQLARLYLVDTTSSAGSCESSEAALYQSLVVGLDDDNDDASYCCRLVAIEQQADTSDYSNMAGGAMAVFQLNGMAWK